MIRSTTMYAHSLLLRSAIAPFLKQRLSVNSTVPIFEYSVELVRVDLNIISLASFSRDDTILYYRILPLLYWRLLWHLSLFALSSVHCLLSCHSGVLLPS